MAELSPLRRRMIEDMTIRNMSPATQRSYISAVSKFSRYFGRSPDKLTLDDVHAFQVHLVSTGICRLCLEGLSRRRRRQDHVFEARRVHPALPTPRLTRRLPSHSPLRIPRQWPPNAKARPLSLAPDRRGRTDDARKDKIANIRAERNRRP